jgi:transposase-like protein
MHQAWSAADAKLARRQLERLAASLEKQHPSAAASVREGLEETLTLQRLGIQSALYRTLRSTNAIENLNGGVATYTRNVKRWRGGRMILRWVGAALAEVQKGFRRVRGHDDLPKLIAALNRQIDEQDHQKVA